MQRGEFHPPPPFVVYVVDIDREYNWKLQLLFAVKSTDLAGEDSEKDGCPV